MTNVVRHLCFVRDVRSRDLIKHVVDRRNVHALGNITSGWPVVAILPQASEWLVHALSGWQGPLRGGRRGLRGERLAVAGYGRFRQSFWGLFWDDDIDSGNWTAPCGLRFGVT